MMVWLVCKTCGTKEEWPEQTELVGCPKCGAARYAEDDDGKPLFLFSEPQDFERW